MEKMIDKISKYNYFNNLFIGIITFVICKYYLKINFKIDEFYYEIFMIYLMGITINRIGSCFFEFLFEKFKIISKEPFNKFLEASKNDEKINILIEERNIYRSIMTLFIIAQAYKLLNIWISSYIINSVAIMAITVIYILAFIKQNKYIVARIKGYFENKGSE